ncbi:MAG TPA: glycosyl hydrolase family 18 protein [Dehalococcoidia bacterium]|nr:glycosyl hydrolase family 18 protein [Dehalococcoidia bacterium]
MASDKSGPFDPILRGGNAESREPDRAAVYVIGTIIGLAVLLLVLVLPPISILSRGDGGNGGRSLSGPGQSDTYSSSVRSGMPKLPAGLSAVSAMFDLSAPAGRSSSTALTVPLKEKQSDQNNLALYTYIEGKWQRLADVTLTAGGAAARGEVSALPGNVAVLKRSKATLQVAGALPAGTTVDPHAVDSLTALHPLVFIPADNGDIAGQPPAVPPAAYTVVPGLVAPVADVVDGILRDPDTRAHHAQAIADAVKQGNYAGIDIDYHSVNPSLREQYTDFVSKLAQALHEDRRTLTLTLPLPANANGSVDTGAYDWEKLGAQADTIEIAGELDQELYFQDTEAALDYITGKVDRSKLLLTVTALSVERGGDGLRAMPLADALSLAGQVTAKVEGDIAPGAQVQLVAQNLAPGEGASGMHWDDTARAVTFSYPGRGGKRTVWIANQFSTAFRLELVERYGLAGVALTDVSQEGGGADVWPAVRELADSGSITLVKPNGALFAPAWTASAGTVAPATGDTVTWTAPSAPGTYELTVIVSDGAVRASQKVSLDVRAPAP